MMNFWSLCTHFNIYCSFWRFWNAASFNLVLTSFSLEYVITVVFLPFSRFSAYFFDDLPVSLTISVSDVFTYLVFTFVPFTKTNLPADPYNRFLQYWHFAQFPFGRWRETITRPAWASCHYSNCHWPRAWRRFRRTRPSRAFAADSLRWQWPVREKEFFEREFDRLVDFSCAFR